MFALLVAVAAQTVVSTAPSCAYDEAAMRALDEQAFDQDMAGGWRALENRGCDAAAAEAIRNWRTMHAPSGLSYLLSWHEGQLRANAGQIPAALALFAASRKSVAEDAGFGWNLYVDGTIAFLKRDRPAFDVARARLAVLPRPAGYAPVGPDGKPAKVRWPMNINVLDGFARCWGRPYKQAYACATPLFKVPRPETNPAK